MATLVKNKDNKYPNIMTVVKDDNDVLFASVNLNIVQLSDNTYEWDALVLPDFALNNIYRADTETKKSVLIAHIIKAYYNDNQMTAILSNYLMDPNDEHYAHEFKEMQKVRSIAKETVKEIIKNRLF